MKKDAYRRFLAADPERLHFAAHSHHYWPDCTREAHLRYWDDSAQHADHKWTHIFGELIPTVQCQIARILNISHSENIAFAPNTHEFIARLLSCFDPAKKLRVLTTDGEFHSFARQIGRYEELPNVHVDRVPVEPFGDFQERFIENAASGAYDLVFISQVFYNSGFVFRGANSLVDRLRSTKSMVVLDGYHAFCALPVDLRPIEDRIFYLAGGYKYAQSGEGAAFLYVPPACELRPLNTGWFSSFSTLEKPATGLTQYGPDGMRFWGSTFDPSGLYRMNAVFSWWEQDGITVQEIHEHVQKLQGRFLERITTVGLKTISRSTLVAEKYLDLHGHFLTFRILDAERVCQWLAKNKIIVDYRGDRLRFGFGIYHDADDVDKLVDKLHKLGV